MKYGLFDSDGFPVGFFAADIHGPLMLPIYGPAPEPSEDNPQPVAPVVGERRNPAIPDGVVAITDEQWGEFINNSGRRRWNGKGVIAYEPPVGPPPVPSVISDRQFAQALALAGTITEAEALAWAARGELPQAMEDALDQIPDTDGQRFGARMMLAAATSYERHLPLTEQLGALLTNPATGDPYDPAALDALWSRAAAL
ncbi:hypothetical protein MPPM_3865 [Methylorubrum populi]|uniref:Uncharacterized protein n=1 Tax=Methylorubrum populi TaxID=223967 RepID=A0A160PKS7_9HYPH|nr:hypothetical protein [Methylorubrum populi]BAU92470.1 hypothetical protein MPPM_3865 [Methylorubrum populi]